MKAFIIKAVLLLVITLALHLLGLNQGLLGEVLIALAMATGIVFAGFRNPHAMLSFSIAMLTFSTRPLGLLPFWSCFALGIFSLWAWNKQTMKEDN